LDGLELNWGCLFYNVVCTELKKTEAYLGLKQADLSPKCNSHFFEKGFELFSTQNLHAAQ
jgi:hypothetical protein